LETKHLEGRWIVGEQDLAEAGVALATARDLLLGASQKAGGRHDWAQVRKLVDLAERAGTLLGEVQALEEGSEGPEPATPPTRMCAGCRRMLDSQTSVCPYCEYDLVANKRPDYPRFFRRGGCLVREGLKRDGRDVYDHSVPRDVFNQILERLKGIAAARAGRGARSFPIADVGKGLRVPGYRVYAVVSYLLSKGLLLHARKGAYLFADPAGFAEEATKLWDSLPVG
jgi:hypothetical protein